MLTEDVVEYTQSAHTISTYNQHIQSAHIIITYNQHI